MGEELREQLAEAAQQRANADETQKATHDRENRLIRDAWRARIPPAEIAAITGRSPAHIRNLRPEDVPPLRRGGMAATKKTTRKGRK